jgi:hypothetical protein
MVMMLLRAVTARGETGLDAGRFKTRFAAICPIWSGFSHSRCRGRRIRQTASLTAGLRTVVRSELFESTKSAMRGATSDRKREPLNTP